MRGFRHKGANKDMIENTFKKRNVPSVIRMNAAKMFKRPFYGIILFVLGLPVFIFVCIYFVIQNIRQKDVYRSVSEKARQRLIASGYQEKLQADLSDQLQQKLMFFDREKMSRSAFDLQVNKWVDKEFDKRLQEEVIEDLENRKQEKVTFYVAFLHLLSNPLFLIITTIPGILMYLFILIYSNPFSKYLFDRLMMTVFVVLGVIIFVFTILYLSPSDPAANIIGETATQEQIESFNHIYGLDEPYFVQLWDSIKIGRAHV